MKNHDVSTNKYSNFLDKKIDRVIKLKEANHITEKEAQTLIRLLVAKELKNDLKDFTREFIQPQRQSTFLLLYKETQVNKLYV